MQLEVKVRKTIGTFELDNEFTILSHRTGVFGPSGSGKSTLMSLLAGLSTPDSGYIRMNGDLLFDSEKKINCRPDKRGIGVVFQHAHLFPHMSVKRNLLYGYKRTPKENRKIEPEALFSLLGINPLLERQVHTLSGGERQRVALGRTVLTCPRLILMDEPMTGLDEDNKFKIIPYLNKVSSGLGIPLLFISHSMLEMRMMTDEVLILEKGSIAQHLPTESFAETIWDQGHKGYANLLRLGSPTPHNDLFAYSWGDAELIVTEEGTRDENLFQLDAREVLLFKQHPQATSARNLLKCRVERIFTSGNRVRVELRCGDEKLIAQIVPEAVRELGIEEGCRVIAAIKATAFRKIC